MKRLGLLALALLLAGCGGSSSPTEPTLTASLNGYVHDCWYYGGTITVRDAGGNTRATALSAAGDYAFGAVFVPGPYDVLLDMTGRQQTSYAMHGQDSSSPAMKTGENHFYSTAIRGSCN